MRTRRGESGLTLVEVMIVVAIIGILAIVGIPTFRNMMPRIRLDSVTTTLVNEIAMFRMSAIAKSADCRVIFSPSAESYTFERYSGGWIATGAVTSFKGGGTDLVGLTYTSDGSAAPTTLQLNASGTTGVPLTKQGVRILLQTPDGEQQRRVIVEYTGRVWVQRSTDGGGTWSEG